jgi:hypothetical protein
LTNPKAVKQAFEIRALDQSCVDCAPQFLKVNLPTGKPLQESLPGFLRRFTLPSFLRCLQSG